MFTLDLAREASMDSTPSPSRRLPGNVPFADIPRTGSQCLIVSVGPASGGQEDVLIEVTLQLTRVAPASSTVQKQQPPFGADAGGPVIRPY